MQGGVLVDVVMLGWHEMLGVVMFLQGRGCGDGRSRAGVMPSVSKRLFLPLISPFKLLSRICFLVP